MNRLLIEAVFRSIGLLSHHNQSHGAGNNHLIAAHGKQENFRITDQQAYGVEKESESVDPCTIDQYFAPVLFKFHILPRGRARASAPTDNYYRDYLFG